METCPTPEPSTARIFDRQGLPIGIQRFAELWNDAAYRLVASDRIGRVRVETVWLGVDQGRAERPALFATAVLDKSRPFDLRLASTIAEARACHRTVVEEVAARRPPLCTPDFASADRKLPKPARADF